MLMLICSIQSAWLAARQRVTGRLTGDRGEGVISTAIAVLIMALLGAAMWLAFDAMFTSTTNNTSTNLGSIGA